jgi:hypothetical protein
MLNQVIAEPAPTRDIPAPPAPEEPDLLSSVISEPGTTQSIPAPPTRKRSSTGDREQHQNKPTPEDNLLEMLSDICGEQKETD